MLGERRGLNVSEVAGLGGREAALRQALLGLRVPVLSDSYCLIRGSSDPVARE